METIHALRLKPGQDLKSALQEFVNLANIQAGWIISAIGSLTHYTLRFANRQNCNEAEGFFEIISLSGTLSVHGSHIHIAISDRNGALIGGHLMEGCCIYTTAEVILGESHDLIFTRENQWDTWRELQIIKR